MNAFTKSEVERILRAYDADNDMGPAAPVTWREERLANAVLEQQKEIKILKETMVRLVEIVDLHLAKHK